MSTRVFYTADAKNWQDLLKSNKAALKADLKKIVDEFRPNDEARSLLESLLPLYDLGILPTSCQSAYKTNAEYIKDTKGNSGYWFQREQQSYTDFLLLDDGVTTSNFSASVLADRSLIARITDYSTGSAVLRQGSCLESQGISFERKSDSEDRLEDTEWLPLEGWVSDPVPAEDTCLQGIQGISGNIIWCQVTTEEDVSVPDRIRELAETHMNRQGM